MSYSSSSSFASSDSDDDHQRQKTLRFAPLTLTQVGAKTIQESLQRLIFPSSTSAVSSTHHRDNATTKNDAAVVSRLLECDPTLLSVHQQKTSPPAHHRKQQQDETAKMKQNLMSRFPNEVICTASEVNPSNKASHASATELNQQLLSLAVLTAVGKREFEKKQKVLITSISAFDEGLIMMTKETI